MDFDDYDELNDDDDLDQVALKNMAERCEGELCEHGRCDNPAVVQSTGSYREYYGAGLQTWTQFLCSEHSK